MESKVLKEFTDKESGVLYMPGSYFSGEKKRVDELVKLGFLQGDLKKGDEKKKDGK